MPFIVILVVGIAGIAGTIALVVAGERFRACRLKEVLLLTFTNAGTALDLGLLHVGRDAGGDCPGLLSFGL